MTEGLTIQKLLDAAKLVKPVAAMPRFIITPNAVKDTEQRLFPVSRNRSRRIHKKLVKKFGGEFRKVPCIIQIGDTMYVHPAVEAELNKRIAKRIDSDLERAFMGNPLATGFRGLL
ncbi:hypothetical protein ACIPUD_10485 [Bradyrhizobium sp. CAR08]